MIRKHLLSLLLTIALGSVAFPADAANVPAPAGVAVKRDIAYGQDAKQRIDVYTPTKTTTDAPIIFMVHGGGWVFGDKASPGVVRNKVAYWVPKGFVFVSVNNRLAPSANPIEQTEDVARALAYVQAHAAEWGGDAARVIMMGHSAGAYLVDMIAADPKFAHDAGAKPWLGTISLDIGALDVVARMREPHAAFFEQSFGRDPEFWKTASPLNRVSGKPHPILLICSSVRQKSDCEQCTGFAHKFETFGARAQVVPIPLRHDEINRDLGTPGKYTDTVDAFINTLLK